MYFYRNGKKFPQTKRENFSSIEHYGDGSKSKPLWIKILLGVVGTALVLMIIFTIYNLVKRKRKVQRFGFRFY